MKYILLFLLTFFLLAQKTFGQKSNDGLVVKTDGYLINLDGDVIFQPCEDSTLTVWQSLDNRSFGVWCNQIHDNYCDAFERCGDSLNVTYKFVSDTFYNSAKLTYFYCTMESAMFFIGNNSNEFKVYDQPKYQILHNGISYPLKGFYIREILRKIIPKKLSDLRIMYHYYTDKGWSVPKWLDDEVDRRLSK